LGLSLSRKIVEAHAGTLLVESAPDRGTRVTLRLPIATQPAQASA
jgi:signal transduction histidine kinase